MTDRRSALSLRKENIAVLFMTYTRMRSTSYNFIVVVEGYDEPYYHDRFKRYINYTVFLKASGKKNVLKLREAIQNNEDYKSDSKVVFIIDADFDDNTNYITDNIYITPCYSVENFYFNNALFKSVLSSEFHLCEYENPLEFEKVMSWILERKKEYLAIIREYNIFVKTHRMHESENSVGIKLNLKNVNDTKIYSISSSNKIIRNMINIPEVFDQTEEVSSELMTKAAAYFPADDEDGIFFRGKQHAYFIFKIFEILKKDRTNHKTIFTNKSSVSINLSPDSVLSAFSQYSLTPCCLEHFIRKFIYNIRG